MITAGLVVALAFIVTSKIIIRWISVHDDIQQSSRWEK